MPHTSAVGFPGKRYFQHTKLADIVGAYPMTSGLDDQAALEERQQRESFLDFLLGILDLDPSCRYPPGWINSHCWRFICINEQRFCLLALSWFPEQYTIIRTYVHCLSDLPMLGSSYTQL